MSKPKRLPHIPGHKYRICRKCDYEYNVSKYDNWGKIYLCPKCRGRKSNERIEELDKFTDSTSDYEVEEFKE